jgi:hypothetical protein
MRGLCSVDPAEGQVQGVARRIGARECTYAARYIPGGLAGGLRQRAGGSTAGCVGDTTYGFCWLEAPSRCSI